MGNLLTTTTGSKGKKKKKVNSKCEEPQVSSASIRIRVTNRAERGKARRKALMKGIMLLKRTRPPEHDWKK